MPDTFAEILRLTRWAAHLVRNHMSIGRIGFRCGVAAFVATIGYDIVQLLQVAGVLRFPLDEILIYAASLAIVVPFVLEMVALHHLTPGRSATLVLGRAGLRRDVRRLRQRQLFRAAGDGDPSEDRRACSGAPAIGPIPAFALLGL